MLHAVMRIRAQAGHRPAPRAVQHRRVQKLFHVEAEEIARAIAMQPELLLFDEPTSALDPELVGEVLETIREITKAGNTMLIVSHEMNFVKNVATKVIFMEGGKIVEMGTPQQVFVNPKNERTRDFLIKNSIVIPPEFSI